MFFLESKFYGTSNLLVQGDTDDKILIDLPVEHNQAMVKTDSGM